MFILPIKSIGQKFRYWTSMEVYANYEGKKQKAYIYLKKGSNFREIKIVNSSCFDVEYRIKVNFKNSSRGPVRAEIDSRGILKRNEYKTFYKSVSSSARYTEMVVYGDAIRGPVGMFNPKISGFDAISRDQWLNDKSTLKCLGFDSKEKYLAYEKKIRDKRDQEYAERKRKEELKQKKLKAAKLKKWMDRGIGSHLKHYSNKKQNSFFIDVPADSLEMFAKIKGQYLLVINTFPTKYDLNKLNLTEDQKAFIESNIVAGTLRDWGFRKKDNKKLFIDWMQEKKIKGGVPLILLFDPEGNVLYNKYTNTTDLPKIIPALMDELFKQLPTID